MSEPDDKGHTWDAGTPYGMGAADRMLYTCQVCGIGRTEALPAHRDGPGVYGPYRVWDGVQTCDEVRGVEPLVQVAQDKLGSP